MFSSQEPSAETLPRSLAASHPVKSFRAPHPLLLAALLLLPVLLLYLPFTSSPLVFDDAMTLNDAVVPTYRNWRTLLEMRGLPHVTFFWTYFAGPHHMFWWRAGNILLHGFNAWLLMVFAQRLCATSLPAAADKRASLAWPAFWAALLFAVHPVAVFGAGYLSQRTIIMATSFSLLTWLAWLKGTQEGSRSALYVACGCFLLAVMCKEHAIMAAPVAALLTVLSPRPLRDLAKQVAVPLLLFALTGLFVVYKIKAESHIIGHAYQYLGPELLAREAQLHQGFDRPHAYLLSIITQAGFFFQYLGLWLFPVPGWMSVDMYEPFAPRVFSSPFIYGLISYVVYGAGAFWLLLQRGRRGVVGFALLCPWLLFMTEFSTVRIQEPFVLYRSYLWLPGLLAVLPLLLRRVPSNWLAIGMVATFLALAPLTLERLQTFSDPVLLWDDAAKLASGQYYRLGMERIFTNRGNGWAKMGLPGRAIADYQVAIQINPHTPHPHYGLGGMYIATHRYAEAIHEYDQAARLDPQAAQIYYFRGMARIGLGRQDDAVRDFNEALKRYPAYAEAWLQRGIAEAQLKQYATALHDLDQAYALDARLKRVFWEKGRIYAQLRAVRPALENYRLACVSGIPPACKEVLRPGR